MLNLLFTLNTLIKFGISICWQSAQCLTSPAVLVRALLLFERGKKIGRRNREKSIRYDAGNVYTQMKHLVPSK